MTTYDQGWVWAAWFLAFVILFAVLEARALIKGHKTLSRSVWMLTKAWPPLPFFIGLVVGFLACHFWWIGPGCDLVEPQSAVQRSTYTPQGATRVVSTSPRQDRGQGSSLSCNTTRGLSSIQVENPVRAFAPGL